MPYRIEGVLSCFDRVIFRGYLPLSYPQGMGSFLYQQNIPLKQFVPYATETGERIKEHVKKRIAEAGAPYRHLASKEPMEELARKIVREKGIRQGIVCGFSQMETSRSYRFEFIRKPALRRDYRRTLVQYVFIMHAVLGLIHVKIHTWFPLTMQVYINGHDVLAKNLDERG